MFAERVKVHSLNKLFCSHWRVQIGAVSQSHWMPFEGSWKKGKKKKMVELSQELRRNYCWNTLQFNSERWRENFFIINFHSCPIPLVSKLSFSFSLYFYSRTTSTSDALIQSSSHHIQQYNNFLNIISVNILHFHSFTNSIEPHYTLITFSYSQQLSLQSFFSFHWLSRS